MKREIRNPYTSIKGYQCFGCAPDNTQGLRMRFHEDGERVVCLWEPEAHFQGFGNILHGGIHASLHDEAAAWAVFVKCGTSGMTTSLSLRFHRPAFTHQGPLRIEALVSSTDRHLVTLATSLLDGAGRVCSEAEVVYFTWPEPIARKKLYYPGRDAFVSAEDTPADPQSGR